jgi:hypothetical protein
MMMMMIGTLQKGIENCMPLGFEISQDIEFDRSDYNLVN